MKNEAINLAKKIIDFRKSIELTDIPVGFCNKCGVRLEKMTPTAFHLWMDYSNVTVTFECEECPNTYFTFIVNVVHEQGEAPRIKGYHIEGY